VVANATQSVKALHFRSKFYDMVPFNVVLDKLDPIENFYPPLNYVFLELDRRHFIQFGFLSLMNHSIPEE
jgi:hypothetical protein